MMKMMSFEMQNDMRNIENCIRRSPKYVAEKKLATMAQTYYEKYSDVYNDILNNKITVAENPPETLIYSKFHSKDIQKYTHERSILKQYWRDSLLKYSELYKNKKEWIQFDSTHEAAMQFFLQHYTEYGAARQHRFLTTDYAYWRRTVIQFIHNTSADLLNKTDDWAAFTEKTQDICTFMQPNQYCSSPQKPFEASIMLLPVVNSAFLRYTINGEAVKHKNGVVYFKIPSGQASQNSKTMVITSTLSNPATGQSSTVKGEIKYSVFK
jgi:hypothetical protein